jgi:hypothetical protein
LQLASAQFRRHTLSNQREDLDSAIVHLTESILLPTLSWLQYGSFILDALFYLASVLLLRSEVTKQPEDVISAAKFLFHLRDQPHGITLAPRHQVTELLVETLALQVELVAGNVMQNIREMAVLSHELLIMETSDIDTTRLLDLVSEVVRSNINPGVPDQPLDELIECLRAAMKCRPDLPQVPATFAKSLVFRYRMTYVNDDYEEAMSILDEMATSGNSQDKSVAKAQGFATGLAATLACSRSNADESPEYLEEAIYRIRTCHSSSSYMELFSDFDMNMEVPAKRRSYYFGSVEEVEEPSSSRPIPEISGYDQTASRVLEVLNDVDTTQIDESIKKGGSIADSSHEARISYMIFFKEFLRTKKIEYLNESISVFRPILESLALPQDERFHTIPFLS